jgi:hypothetical protein
MEGSFHCLEQPCYIQKGLGSSRFPEYSSPDGLDGRYARNDREGSFLGPYSAISSFDPMPKPCHRWLKGQEVQAGLGGFARIIGSEKEPLPAFDWVGTWQKSYCFDMNDLRRKPMNE